MLPGKALAWFGVPPMERRNSVLISLLVSAAVITLLIVVSGLTFQGIVQAVARIPAWAYFPLAIGQGTVVVFAAQKWGLILSASGQGLPIREAVRGTALGALGGQFLPIQIVTPAIRAWIARRYNIAPSRAVGTSLLEQVFEVLVLAAMAFAAFSTSLFDTSFTMAVVLALVVAGALTFSIRFGVKLSEQVVRTGASLSPTWASARLNQLADGFSRAQQLSNHLLLTLTGLSILRYVLLAALNLLVLSFLVPEVDPLVLLVAYPAILLLISLPFLPGGLGVVELTWVGLFVAAGVAPSAATEAALAWRVVMVFGFLLAAPFMVFLPVSKKAIDP